MITGPSLDFSLLTWKAKDPIHASAGSIITACELTCVWHLAAGSSLHNLFYQLKIVLQKNHCPLTGCSEHILYMGRLWGPILRVNSEKDHVASLRDSPPPALWLVYSGYLIINHSTFFVPCNPSSFFGSFFPSLTRDWSLSAPTFQRPYNKTQCLQYPPEAPPRVNSIFRLRSLLEATCGFSQEDVGKS